MALRVIAVRTCRDDVIVGGDLTEIIPPQIGMKGSVSGTHNRIRNRLPCDGIVCMTMPRADGPPGGQTAGSHRRQPAKTGSDGQPDGVCQLDAATSESWRKVA